MFELLALDSRFTTDNAGSDGRNRSVAGTEQQHARSIAQDDGQLSHGETLLLLAGLSSVLASIWLTVNAIV